MLRKGIATYSNLRFITINTKKHNSKSRDTIPLISTVSGSLDECFEQDGSFYITKDTTYRWKIFFRLFCLPNPAQFYI
jgi:hypothetical protein